MTETLINILIVHGSVEMYTNSVTVDFFVAHSIEKDQNFDSYSYVVMTVM